MPQRKIVQDMVPSPRKARLKDVMPVSSPQVPAKTPAQPVITHSAILEKEKPPTLRRRPLILIIIAVVCLAVIILSLFFVSAHANVVIIPKKQVVAVNSTFIACKDIPCSTVSASSDPGIGYEMIQIPSREIHQTVQASTGSLAETYAQGSIILYNNYSVAPQVIAQGTRVSNTAGLIYRTIKTVVIPGLKKTGTATGAGRSTVPGSVSVSVISISPGPQYNIQPTDLTGDFRIVGYKGTPRYDAFYGRLNPTNSIAGGASGYQKIVASTTLAATYSALRQKLFNELIAEAKALVPQGYIMYDDASSITSIPLAPQATSSASDLADVGMQATFSGIMFKENDLVNAAVRKTLPSLDMNTVFPHDSFTVDNLTGLSFTIIGTSTSISASTTALTFMLKGTFTITGTVPGDTLKNQLIGQDTAQSNAIFASYGAIASVRATISPFWRHTFPDASNKIIITIQQ